MRLKVAAFALTFLTSILLLNYGALRDGISWHLQRELCSAAASGDVGEMRLLISFGARPGGWNTSYQPILNAAWDGQTDSVGFLLEEGVDVNSRDKFLWTPLMAAVYKEHEATVKLLLSKGADVNLIGDGGTALDIAVGNKNQELINLLGRAGGKSSAELLSRTEKE